MQTVGNITGYVDLAQILLYAFWIFSLALFIILFKKDTARAIPLSPAAAAALWSRAFRFPSRKPSCWKVAEVSLCLT